MYTRTLMFGLLFAVSICPAFAQRNEAKAVVQVMRGAEMAQQVSRQVVNAQLASRLVFPLTFVNLPSSVIPVPSQVIVRPHEASRLHIQPEDNTVQAAVFPTKQLDRHMPEFDDLNLYSLVGLRGPSFYRGMVLPDLQSLKQVLTKGLEWKKTNYNRIFASRYLAVALDHAYINPGPLPVLIRIPETNRLRFNNIMDGDNWTVTFGRDIPADMLSDVMVFLKINGIPGWYKATLENEELVLTPVTTSRVFTFSELIKHDFQIPDRNIEDIW